MDKITYEERYFLKPLFKKATFYMNQIKNSADLYENEELYQSGVVVEGSGSLERGSLLEMMFTSSLYGLYGSSSFVILDSAEIKDAIAITAIREDSEDETEWNFTLEDVLVN